jgi:hypothetical protein
MIYNLLFWNNFGLSSIKLVPIEKDILGAFNYQMPLITSSLCDHSINLATTISDVNTFCIYDTSSFVNRFINENNITNYLVINRGYINFYDIIEPFQSNIFTDKVTNFNHPGLVQKPVRHSQNQRILLKSFLYLSEVSLLEEIFSLQLKYPELTGFFMAIDQKLASRKELFSPYGQSGLWGDHGPPVIISSQGGDTGDEDPTGLELVSDGFRVGNTFDCETREEAIASSARLFAKYLGYIDPDTGRISHDKAAIVLSFRYLLYIANKYSTNYNFYQERRFLIN